MSKMSYAPLADNPLVSIYMPAYNAGEFIRTAINSVISQDYSNWELLICDDGSVDETRTVVREFTDSRIKLYSNGTNIGNLRTVNFLLSLCHGELITCLDSDDWCSQDRIRKQVQAFLADNDLGLCGTQSVRVKQSGKLIKSSRFPLDYEAIKNSLPNNFAFNSASIMFRSELVKESKRYYHPYFDRIGGADWYFFGSIILETKMINLPDSCYFYRIHSTSVTNSPPSNPEKYIIGDAVSFLISQRLKFSEDGLGDNLELINEFRHKLSELKAPYLVDPTLLNRKYAVRLMLSKSFTGLLLVLFDLCLRPGKAIHYYHKVISRYILRIL